MSAIQAFKQYGLSRNVLINLILCSKEIPKEINDCVSCIDITFSGKEFKLSIINSIKTFSRHYLNCTPEQAFNAKKIKASYREAASEFKISRYLVISILEK